MCQIAREKGISVADVLRNAVEVLQILRGLSLEGKRLFFETEGEQRIEIIIPGTVSNRLHGRPESSNKTGAGP
jgi:hypothetical protein